MGLNYYRRIFSAYLGSGHSQLSFWHDVPEPNANSREDILGEYYMPFLAKAHYDGPRDTQGIPLLDYRGSIGEQYNPIAIAQYALGNYNLWCRNDDRDALQRFRLAADWLTDNLEVNDHGVRVWMHHFDWEYRDCLKSPWYSGLAQGQGISVLVRAWRETGEDKYIVAASEAMACFEKDTASGGVIYYDDRGDLWIEEYIVTPPTHILNGFIWATWGIFDYALATRNASADLIFRRSMKTILSNLSRYDTGSWSLYEQSGTFLPMIASSFYHRLHIAQLRVLYRLTGEPSFQEYALVWEGYYKSRIKRTLATVQKVIFKLCYY
jgi:heparosan-N-sulfate-glucuronate 5-epimerase